MLIQQRFGYSEAEADGILRDVAIELFAREPDLYAQTSLGLFGELLVGTEQNLGGQGKSGGVVRFPNAQDKYDFWNERIRQLALPATTAEANEFRRAQSVANLFQPFRYAPLLLGLLGIGLVAATLVPGLAAGLAAGPARAVAAAADGVPVRRPARATATRPIRCWRWGSAAVWRRWRSARAACSTPRRAAPPTSASAPIAGEHQPDRHDRQVVAVPVDPEVGRRPDDEHQQPGADDGLWPDQARRRAAPRTIRRRPRRARPPPGRPRRARRRDAAPTAPPATDRRSRNASRVTVPSGTASSSLRVRCPNISCCRNASIALVRPTGSGQRNGLTARNTTSPTTAASALQRHARSTARARPDLRRRPPAAEPAAPARTRPPRTPRARRAPARRSASSRASPTASPASTPSRSDRRIPVVAAARSAHAQPDRPASGRTGTAPRCGRAASGSARTAPPRSQPPPRSPATMPASSAVSTNSIAAVPPPAAPSARGRAQSTSASGRGTRRCSASLRSSRKVARIQVLRAIRPADLVACDDPGRAAGTAAAQPDARPDDVAVDRHLGQGPVRLAPGRSPTFPSRNTNWKYCDGQTACPSSVL